MALQRTDQRELVLAILKRIREEDTFSHVAVREALESAQDLDRQERAFVKRLAEGVTERRAELDSIIRAHCTSKGRIKPVIRDILRVGLYQICYMDNVPDSAACNEAVKMAARTGRKEQAGFVNALLRSAAREHAETGLCRGQETSSRVWMPPWITRMWEKQLGPEKTQTVLKALMEVRPVTIRFDERTEPEERENVLTHMKEEGLTVLPGEYLPYAFHLGRVPDLRTVYGYQEGLWTVQDESSMLVTEASGLQGGEFVIDICAAPGGKMLHMASRLELLEKKTGLAGRVAAYDKSEEKVLRMKENARRMRVGNVSVGVRDARSFYPEDGGKADLVLCDVPCSGLGVAGKKRDIKYRVTPEKIEALVILQREILRNAVRYVKKGGILLYSTCTIDRRENEEMADFIEQELGLLPDPLAPHLPPGISGISGNRLQLLPGIHGTDGFFISRFRKEEEV